MYIAVNETVNKRETVQSDVRNGIGENHETNTISLGSKTSRIIKIAKKIIVIRVKIQLITGMGSLSIVYVFLRLNVCYAQN